MVGEGAHHQLRGAAAHVDNAKGALRYMPERSRRAREGQPGLFGCREDFDLQPAGLADPVHQLAAVLRAPDCRSGDAADFQRPKLARPLQLRGYHLGNLNKLGFAQPPGAANVGAEMREHALLVDAFQPPVVAVCHQQAGGV